MFYFKRFFLATILKDYQNNKKGKKNKQQNNNNKKSEHNPINIFIL